MTIQQGGAALAVGAGLVWLACAVALICYGIAWSRRHPSGAATSITLGLALIAAGVAASIDPHLFWSAI